MTEVLDKILNYHNNSATFILDDNPMNDEEINIELLAEFVKEDFNAWYIIHDGQYIMYCAKHSKYSIGTDSPDNLKQILAETWGRYTKRKFPEWMNYGYFV